MVTKIKEGGIGMSHAKCFECGQILIGMSKPMEELVADGFPVFCSSECGDKFPSANTAEFNRRLEALR